MVSSSSIQVGHYVLMNPSRVGMALADIGLTWDYPCMLPWIESLDSLEIQDICCAKSGIICRLKLVKTAAANAE